MATAFQWTPPACGIGTLPYSLWLMFDEGTSADLSSDISALSAVLGGAAFPPHLTLIGDMGLRIEEAEEVAGTFRDHVPEHLHSAGLGTSLSYFLAVHVAVRLPSRLERLRVETAQRIHGKGAVVDSPHVSLAYGTYVPEQLRRASAMLGKKYASRQLPVGRLSIVWSAKNIPIDDWKPIRHIEL